MAAKPDPLVQLPYGRAVRVLVRIQVITAFNLLPDAFDEKPEQVVGVNEPVRVVGRKRRVEQVTGVPFAFELAVA